MRAPAETFLTSHYSLRPHGRPTVIGSVNPAHINKNKINKFDSNRNKFIHIKTIIMVLLVY